jgi:hypothetical protein
LIERNRRKSRRGCHAWRRARPCRLADSRRAAGRGLDQRIGPALQIEEGIEGGIDNRIGKAVKLGDRAFGEMDVEQACQRLMDMGEHIGGGHQLPAIAPAIVDAEEGLFAGIPGDQRQEVGEGVARDRALERGGGEAARAFMGLSMLRRPHGRDLGHGGHWRGLAIDGGIGMGFVLHLLQDRHARGGILLADR